MPEKKCSKYLSRIAEQYFGESAARERFLDSMLNPRQFCQALAWTKPRPVDVPFPVEPPAAWQDCLNDQGRLQFYMNGVLQDCRVAWLAGGNIPVAS